MSVSRMGGARRGRTKRSVEPRVDNVDVHWHHFYSYDELFLLLSQELPRSPISTSGSTEGTSGCVSKGTPKLLPQRRHRAGLLSQPRPAADNSTSAMKVGGHAFQRTLLGLVVAVYSYGGGLAFANRVAVGDGERFAEAERRVDRDRRPAVGLDGRVSKVGALDGWARFENGFVNNPQCCLTYVDLHRALHPAHGGGDAAPGRRARERRTIATMLDGAVIAPVLGKYLNGYPFGRGHFYRRGGTSSLPTNGRPNTSITC